MNPVDSDLEEGEILDDSPSSPPLSIKKDRELPRRYVLIENKKVHKHKKRECKNAIRYHAKKLSKCYDKKMPSKDMLNDHHNSRSRTKSHKPVVKHYKLISGRVAKNSPSFSKHSLISEIKFSFKDNIKKSSHPEKNSHPEAYFSESKPKTIHNDSNFHESSKKIECSPKNIADLKENDKRVEKYVDSANLKESHSKKELNDGVILPDLSDDKNEESEDEEELRRIALATCAKRKPLTENSNLNENHDSCASLPESENSVQILPSPKSNPVADNYEIVDMELDEESSNEVQIIDNESLFVIDTQPSSNITENVKESESGSQLKDDSDDDFEADILRAELIGNLFRKRAALEKQIEEEQDKSAVLPEEVPLIQGKSSETYQRPNVDFQPKSSQPTKRHIFRQNGVNKHRKMKYNSKTKASSNKIEMSPKRLVITLNAESSSSEEESDEAEKSVADNPVASIEALISDCRQKSDSKDEKSNETKNNEVIKPVPKALSCLSKAQQEEYNNLMKILELKKKLPVAQEARPQNSVTAHSPLNDLKILEEKLTKFQETLRRKKILMTSISKDVSAKKQVYMKSKLRAQHLKEQFLAAEKVRRMKLDEWSKSCHNFDLVKKSVSGLESKITQMQNLCSKIKQGVSSNLNSLPSNYGQL